MSELADTPKTLHSITTGSGPRLVLVHGFTQTGRCWGEIGTQLSRDHEVIFLDAPGHGGSSEVEVDLVEGGNLIGEAGGIGTYVGYSMGGRFVLHTALQSPHLVQGLVLVGATAGLKSKEERTARLDDDETRARRIEQIGVQAFLDEWLALPLFGGLSEAAAARSERLANTAAGLASSLRLAGTGTQQPSWDQLHTLNMPTLIIAGAHDTKFGALGERMAEAIGSNATFATVDGAGHTAHLEQPEAFMALLEPWLAKHGL
ncbi:MAG: alpha/beta fold hydrolase [Acidimicrobiia bacterium]